MSKLRKQAQNRPCQIRSEYCNHDPATTVLCHIHKPSISGGMGMKANDMLAAHGCSACHDYVDGRTKLAFHSKTERDLYLYEGCFRTQKILADEGKIGVL